MGRVVVIDYVSVDGVVQGPGHVGEDSDGGFKQGGWTRPHLGEHAQYLAGPFTAAGGFLLGRVTYDIWLEYWPNVTDAGDLIARALNTKPKYVASASLANPDWAGTTVLRDVPREVAELREKPGGPLLVMGSSQLTHTLTEHALVDEYRLMIHPVVLGSGKKLFADDGPRLDLHLAGVTSTA